MIIITWFVSYKFVLLLSSYKFKTVYLINEQQKNLKLKYYAVENSITVRFFIYDNISFNKKILKLLKNSLLIMQALNF